LLNWILLGILKVDSSTGLVTTIFDFQDNITDLLSLALKQPFNEVITGDVNYLYTASGELAYQSFVLVKIWTVLCSQTSKPLEENKVPRIHQRLFTSLTMAERRFWNSIWPSIRKQLISVIEEKNVLVRKCNLVFYFIFNNYMFIIFIFISSSLMEFLTGRCLWT
jgi:hypothetical protein